MIKKHGKDEFQESEKEGRYLKRSGSYGR